MKAIPAIHASQLTPLIDFLRASGAPIEHLLESNSISPDVLDDRIQFIPAQGVFRFLESSGRSQHITDIGWRAGYESDLLGSGSWALEACKAATLREALGVLIRRYPQVVPLVRLGSKENARTAWLWRLRLIDLKTNPGHPAVEQFTLARFIKLIRLAAGEEWTPRRLRVECSPYRTPVPATRSWKHTHVQHGAPVLAIELPRELLDRPMPAAGRRIATPHAVNRSSTPTLAEFLRDTLRSEVTQNTLTIERAAEIACSTPRTLRRHLRDEGFDWRAVRDGLLRAKTCSLLTSTDLPIGEIALQMGYSDSAHFSRAFERWQGESPRRYRNRRLNRGGRARPLSV